MTGDDDRLFEVIATLGPMEAGEEWERRLRARCHFEIERRQAGRRSFRIKIIDVVAVASLCGYLSIVATETLRALYS